jgi:uroporphyrinogen-III decarboxylase
MTTLPSRERLLRAIHLQQPDHIPCAFMSFTALRRRLQENLYELAKAELDMGLDSFLFIPSLPRPQRPEHPELRGLPVRFHPEVQVAETQEQTSNGQSLLHKCYRTPAGELTTTVRYTDDWPHGNHIPFIDDYQVPRAVKPLVTGRSDLDALQFLLTPPAAEDVAAFQAEVEQAHAFTEQHGILLAGGWGVGMDMANWLCGMQDLMAKTIEDEPFVTDLLNMLTAWNMARMKVVLSGKIDLYIKRAWYEGCDFVTPRFYRRVILPRLKAEVDLAHEHGASFGYICSSGLRPMFDLFLEAGIDVLIGVDPVQGTHTDLRQIKEKLGERICVWGGVSGAVTVELGSEDEIRQAVRQAVQQLGPAGLILSPVDNITVDAPLTWSNLQIFIDEWQRNR